MKFLSDGAAMSGRGLRHAVGRPEIAMNIAAHQPFAGSEKRGEGADFRKLQLLATRGTGIARLEAVLRPQMGIHMKEQSKSAHKN